MLKSFGTKLNKYSACSFSWNADEKCNETTYKNICENHIHMFLEDVELKKMHVTFLAKNCNFAI